MKASSRLLNILKKGELQNTGSVARDHLANERTFLAWLRTGVGFTALGFGVAYKNEVLEAISPRLRTRTASTADDYEKAAGSVLVGAGLGSIIHGATRYFTNMQLLKQGRFKPNVSGIAAITLMSVVTVLAVMIRQVGGKSRNEAEDSRHTSRPVGIGMEEKSEMRPDSKNGNK